MVQVSKQDRFAAERLRVRYLRAGLILRLAGCERPRQILEYGLEHAPFELGAIAEKYSLTPNSLYSYTGRLLRLGMLTKIRPRHHCVVYELSAEGRLVAECLRQLAQGFPRQTQTEEE